MTDLLLDSDTTTIKKKLVVVPNSRCQVCRKKLVVIYICNACELPTCLSHRYFDRHNCPKKKWAEQKEKSEFQQNLLQQKIQVSKMSSC